MYLFFVCAKHTLPRDPGDSPPDRLMASCLSVTKTTSEIGLDRPLTVVPSFKDREPFFKENLSRRDLILVNEAFTRVAL